MILLIFKLHFMKTLTAFVLVVMAPALFACRKQEAIRQSPRLSLAEHQQAAVAAATWTTICDHQHADGRLQWYSRPYGGYLPECQEYLHRKDEGILRR